MSESSGSDKFWDGTAPPAGLDGVFSDGANWDSFLPPLSNDVAHFGTSNMQLSQNAYKVTFATSPTNQALVVENDNVTFNLGGNLYTTTAAIAMTLGPPRPSRFTPAD